MVSPGEVILALKIAVGGVTLLLVASMVALGLKKPRWHGRINKVFFTLTMATVIVFEVIIRWINPELTSGFTEEARQALRIHLYFSVPSAGLLLLMLYTGVTRRIKYHLPLGILFVILWTGTFITGVFYLPHEITP
jgi:uncharacterized membrane protein YozB (DUF420 family)